jgi:hypothetical protein
MPIRPYEKKQLEAAKADQKPEPAPKRTRTRKVKESADMNVTPLSPNQK